MMKKIESVLTVQEMQDLVVSAFQEIQINNEYEFYGLRFEDKNRNVGETCENSKNNVDREDERDFPEYGSEEYDDMEEMDGTSAWGEESALMQIQENIKYKATIFQSKHAYIIAGQDVGWEQNNGVIDDGEIVIQEAVVLYKIF